MAATERRSKTLRRPSPGVSRCLRRGLEPHKGSATLGSLRLGAAAAARQALQLGDVVDEDLPTACLDAGTPQPCQGP